MLANKTVRMMFIGLLLSVAIATTLVDANPLAYSRDDASKQFFVDLIFASLQGQSSQPGDIVKVVKSNNKKETIQSNEGQQSEDVSEEQSSSLQTKEAEINILPDWPKTDDSDQKQSTTTNQKQDISELQNDNEIKSEALVELPLDTQEKLKEFKSLLEQAVELKLERRRERNQQQQEQEINELLMKKDRQEATEQEEQSRSPPRQEFTKKQESLVSTQTSPDKIPDMKQNDSFLKQLKLNLEQAKLQRQREKETIQKKHKLQEILETTKHTESSQSPQGQEVKHEDFIQTKPNVQKVLLEQLSELKSMLEELRLQLQTEIETTKQQYFPLKSKKQEIIYLLTELRKSYRTGPSL